MKRKKFKHVRTSVGGETVLISSMADALAVITSLQNMIKIQYGDEHAPD